MAELKESHPIKLKNSTWRRIALLQAALEEKMDRKMTRDELIEQMVLEFLDSK